MAYTVFSTYDQEIINDVRPNIILYLSDDQDKLDFGCYGNPNVKTSNVDKLASEGIKFNNFYTSQAICAQAESQIFTGMYPVKNGCMANHIGVKPNVESITSLLKSSGYEVVLAERVMLSLIRFLIGPISIIRLIIDICH